MIFHFDLTAAEIAATSKVMLQGCISEAVRAHRLGHHLLIINRSAADYLATHLDLNSIERATLTKLRADYTQTAMLTQKASTYIRIAALPSGTLRRIGNAIELSVDQAVRTPLYEKTVLLVEDENTDGPLFEFLLENIRAKTVGMVPLSFQSFHGGGERIVDVARRRVNERRLVCVVVDTDMFSPEGSPSDKVGKLNLISHEESWPLIFVQTTPCKETENLIPIDVIAMLECAQERGNELKILNQIRDAEQKIGTPAHQAFWLYFDLKSGCSHSKVSQLTNAAERDWILAKMAHAPGVIESLNGFGSKIVPQVIGTNSACARMRSEIRSADWWHIFGDFISEISWIAVGGARQFT